MNLPAPLFLARRLIDRDLMACGCVRMTVGLEGTLPVYRAALDLVRYAAWKARLDTHCEVNVMRAWCPQHGFRAQVETTLIPTDSSPLPESP